MNRPSPLEQDDLISARRGYGPFFGSEDEPSSTERRHHSIASILMLVGAVAALAFALLPRGNNTGIPAMRVLESTRPLLQSNRLDVTLVGLGYAGAAGFGALLLIAALLMLRRTSSRLIATFGLVCALGLAVGALLMALGSHGIIFDGFWGWVVELCPIPALIGAIGGFAR